MLKELKERFLGDKRTIGAVAELKSLYEAADDPEAFHEALAQGNIVGAADHHPLTAEELHNRIDDMMEKGMQLSEDYNEVLDHDQQDFIEA